MKIKLPEHGQHIQPPLMQIKNHVRRWTQLLVIQLINAQNLKSMHILEELKLNVLPAIQTFI